MIAIGLIITSLASSPGYASYVIYHSSEPSNTQHIGSFPYQTSGFSYSDGRGNSISIGETQYLPYVVNQYPNAVWVTINSNRLPPNAIIQQYINGNPAYFCRVLHHGKTYNGYYMRGEGCRTTSNFANEYGELQVLIR
tara:strand:+ start:205 stop:618 length:414 start_codon:yes stop_codon:yes gene_type:complete